MNRKLKVVLITAGVLLLTTVIAIGLMVYGAIDYTRRCAHIADKQGVTCEVGTTLSIDDLAYFSNYDERRITGITDGEGIISEDGMSITITKAESFATVYVYATNEKAPEFTEHEIKVMITDS